MVSLIQHFEADFLWKVSLKILNSGIILKPFTYAEITQDNKSLLLYSYFVESELKNNKGANQITWKCRLVSAFVVCI